VIGELPRREATLGELGLLMTGHAPTSTRVGVP
jgi:hypothetical protein